MRLMLDEIASRSSWPLLLPLRLSKTFQNFRFSSLALEAIVWPSGDRVVFRIRASWPGKSAILLSEGYDQIDRWLLGKPCDDINSLYSRDH